MNDPGHDKLEYFAMRCAMGNNGGEWASHYTEEQKAHWRRFVLDLVKEIVAPDWFSWDEAAQVLTIDGHRFTRKFLTTWTTSEPGVRFRVISRADGAIMIGYERSNLEAAAPEMKTALEDCILDLEHLCTRSWEKCPATVERIRHTTIPSARAAVEHAEATYPSPDSVPVPLVTAAGLPAPDLKVPSSVIEAARIAANWMASQNIKEMCGLSRVDQ